ncbi:MAG: VOC family protein [Gemmatimonadota bacterium]|nr:VOC family protein [Gemmatimonadota bacterium]
MERDPSPVRDLWPLLFVRDIGRSIQFYTDALGFEVVGKAEGEDGIFWCRLRRGGACFMMQQLDSGADLATPPAPSVGFYFVCDDVDEVFAEFARRGLALDAPAEAYYGMRQLSVPDPDGYGVIFESPTEAWSG